MPYTEIALCIIGMTLYFNAGKIEARGGDGVDHSFLWALLSVLTSILTLAAGAGWLLWALGQVGLLIVIAAVRVALEGREE